MAQLLRQPCDGGAVSGTAVTTANNLQGNQWDSVNKTGTGATLNFDNAHVGHGRATSHKFAFPLSTASTLWTQYKASISGTPANNYLSCYFYLTAIPASNVRILQFLTGSNVSAIAILILSTGLLRVNNSLGSTIATTTAAVPTNTPFRVDTSLTNISGTTGDTSAKFFSGANLESQTADTNGSISSTGSTNIGGLVNDVRLLTSAAVTLNPAWNIWAWDFAYSDTAMPAPMGYLPQQAQTFPPLRAVARASNW